MNETALISTFEQASPMLKGLAYRMLGSMSDAEDAVQETFLKWQKADHAAIENPRAWLTTVCSRHCIDVLRSARRKREDYIGPWLPEPVAEGIEDNPEEQIMLSSSLSLAFLAMLERLTPKERAAYLLREIFDRDYAEVADVIGTTEVACRKLVSRARERIGQKQRRYDPPRESRERLLSAFQQAIRTGETGELGALLSADIRLTADAGGKVNAPRKPLEGPDKILLFLGRVLHAAWAGAELEARDINGEPGLLLIEEGRITGAITCVCDEEGLCREILILRNPEKLGRLQGVGNITVR
ncbi:RNA polymerase sigma factor SigJ [Emcibacter sp.]|uniref:RNA polymerase sigma factor SigJ n=1 Tax=Emcibacter sp. TaxID=1979954 RepID=UPI003A8FC25E